MDDRSGERGNGQGAAATGQVGATLERRRLEKGLSLRDVEQATKIRTRYLEGLEREDYDALPDAVYVQGFLKTYANFLGLDGERLSREFRERRAPRREQRYLEAAAVTGGPGTASGTARREPERETRPPTAPPVVDPLLGGAADRRISGTTLLTVALAVLVLAAAMGGLYVIGYYASGGPGDTREEAANVPEGGSVPEAQEEAAAEDDPAEPSSEEDASEGEPAAETTTGGAEEEASSSETVTATVRVVGSAPSGLTVRTDGTVAADLIGRPGYSQTFEAERTVNVSAANGGAVEVEVNGESASRLGNPGQGATREFTPESRS